MEKEDLKRYAVLVIGITLSLGFAFGAVQSFSSMVDAPAPQQGQSNAELPENDRAEEPFNLNIQEQFTLAFQNDIVFVNLYYETEEQKENLQDLGIVEDELGDKIYLTRVNESEADTLPIEAGIDEYPAFIVVGDNQEAPQRTFQGEEFSNEQLASAICDSMATWGEYSSVCQSL